MPQALVPVAQLAKVNAEAQLAAAEALRVAAEAAKQLEVQAKLRAEATEAQERTAAAAGAAFRTKVGSKGSGPPV